MLRATPGRARAGDGGRPPVRPIPLKAVKARRARPQQRARRPADRTAGHSLSTAPDKTLDNAIVKEVGYARGRTPTRSNASERMDPARPVYVISVAAELVRVHPRTLRIYEGEGLICPARTRTNIRLYSENDIRRVLWIRHLTQNLGVNLAGVRVLFELEERLGMRILEQLYSERTPSQRPDTTPSRRRHAGRLANPSERPETESRRL